MCWQCFSSGRRARPCCGAQQSEILSFVGGFRVNVFIMLVLVLPLYVVAITKFLYRSSPEVRTHKTGVVIACLFITLVRVLKIEQSQSFVYDDLWSGTRGLMKHLRRSWKGLARPQLEYGCVKHFESRPAFARASSFEHIFGSSMTLSSFLGEDSSSLLQRTPCSSSLWA